MKALVTSDTHIYPHKGRQDRLDDCLDVLRWVGNTAIERGIKKVFHLGDLLHEKARIHVRAYQQTFEIIRDFTRQGLEWYILLGNHDMQSMSDWDVNSISPFDAIDGVHVITEPKVMEIGGRKVFWLPYTRDPMAWLERWQNRDGGLLCGHISVEEAQHSLTHSYAADLPVENEADMVRVGAERFVGWEKVLFGHIHLPQSIGHMEYIGSPLELRSDEAGQDKHIGIIDLDTLRMEYVSNDFSPRHLRLRVEELEDHDLNGHFVTVLVDDAGAVDVFELEKRLAGTHMIRRLEIMEIPRPLDEGPVGADQLAEERYNLADGDVIRRFVKATGAGNLDEERLVEVGLSFCFDA